MGISKNENVTFMENKFCQEASDKYLEALEEEGGDPRSVAGRQALKDKRWMPTIDARDARRTAPEKEEPKEKKTK